MNLSLNYSFVNNSIEQYSYISQEKGDDGNMHNIQNTTFGNIGGLNQIALSAYINWSMTKTTRFNANLRGSYINFSSKEPLNLSNHGWLGNFYASMQQTLPWDIMLNINASGNSKMISLQGKSNGSFYYGININKSFLKDKRLTVSARAQNPFNKYFTYTRNTTIDSEKLGHYNNYESFHYLQRSFNVSISWRFGKLQASVKKAQRSIQNDDTKAGGNNSGN